MDNAKPFDIPKRAVWEAYKRVKANQGAAGVDGQSIEQFDEDVESIVLRQQRTAAGAPGGYPQE